MPSSKKSAQPQPLHIQLLTGLDTKARPNGTVITVKSAGKVIAEVCVGKKFARLNFRAEVKVLKGGPVLSGKSKSWPGGGCVLSAENVAALRALLDVAVRSAQGAQGAADVAADLKARQTVTRDVRKRVASAAKTGAPVKAAAKRSGVKVTA
jgi:hypothetical protein